MSTAAGPALDLPLDASQFCVVDVETTGLDPFRDRVVEIAVLRCDAHGNAISEWHTMVNPQRPMDAEWVHGITDDMVAAAPTFSEITPRLLEDLDGAVLVAHNAAFDRRFLEAELATAGHDLRLPYLCTMHMRRHVGLAAPVMHRLSWACWQAAAPIDQAHAAVTDARAVACLLHSYLRGAREAGHKTLAALARTAAAADACEHPVVLVEGAVPGDLRLLARAAPPPRASVARAAGPEAITRYQAAVADAVEDFVLDGDEVGALHKLVIELGLSGDQLADAHQEFIRHRLAVYLDDDELCWEEYEQLRILSRLLALDGRWLEELVADVRPRHVALTLSTAEQGELSREENEEALQAPLSVCFTGPFEAMPLTRTEVQALAADAGMIVRPGVSAKLDLLVCLDPFAGTGKLRKAEQHGTVLVDQETFLAIAGAATPTPSPTAEILNVVAARRRAREAKSKAATPRQSVGPEPRPGSASRAPSPSLSALPARVLWCESGAHEWTRPAQRGRPPKRCPEH